MVTIRVQYGDHPPVWHRKIFDVLGLQLSTLLGPPWRPRQPQIREKTRLAGPYGSPKGPGRHLQERPRSDPGVVTIRGQYGDHPPPLAPSGFLAFWGSNLAPSWAARGAQLRPGRASKQACEQASKQASEQASKHASNQASKQANKQASGHADRQACKQASRQAEQAERAEQAHKQTCMHACMHARTHARTQARTHACIH